MSKKFKTYLKSIIVPVLFTCKAGRVRPGTRTKLYRTALCTDIDTNCPGKRAEKNFSRYMAPTIPGQFFSAFSHNYKKTFISAYYSDKNHWQIICNKKNKLPVKRLVFASGSCLGCPYPIYWLIGIKMVPNCTVKAYIIGSCAHNMTFLMLL